MRSLRFVLLLLPLVVVTLAVLPQGLQAKEETLAIFTSSDNRSELAPCG